MLSASSLLLSVLTAIFVPDTHTHVNAQQSGNCKCTPTSDCWPSATEWSALNDTVSGQLIQAVPPASVCYSAQPNYNEDACDYIRSQWFNSSFHAEDPISIDYPVWANNSCNPIFPNGTSVTGDVQAGEKGCSIGDYPVYVVNATQPEHIAGALQWAAQKNVRIVVKNTGHSYPGRSTGYSSLSIWTHNFRGITYHEDFQPQYCPLNETQKAATIAAGEVGSSVITELQKHNAVVVTGANPDVGLAGWFTGGGHGFLSSTHGLGADNLLEATLITPTGDLLTVNACQYSDLFFAIRGGGGSTYGVITSAVMKAYTAPETTTHNLQLTTTHPNISTEYWDLIAFLHSQMPALKAGGMQGYYFMVGPPIMPTLSFIWVFNLYDKPPGTADTLFAPIKTYLDARRDLFIYHTTSTTSSYYDFYAQGKNELVATGGSAYGSRLLPARALTEDVDALARTFEAIGPSTDLSRPSGTLGNTLLLGHLIAPPSNVSVDNGVNPAWRTAITHFIVSEGWLDGMPQSLIDSVYADITENKTYALRQLAPDSGAYFNECDSYEPDWQYSFFGPNYAHLWMIKQTYDPEGVLWCRRCVGSELWVEQPGGRLCRPEGYEKEQTPI
ncbi:FAD binding domain-containing protein [Mytilinidion resinicola]|uniref:FAD binding domain-containing protein n=1 Tax=Mytilinidion resinicola TaxID=574789 RepID=A0A6A6Y385_9PEZI|nr:FAD binding domain-containing protein [Mytilinidion resinicola]KAF2802247.1 FAD binding domain-containing protein [Mytilinidion resinicola]